MSPIFHNRECFEVVFSDGTRVIADAEHRWRTTACNRGNMRGVPKSEWSARAGGSAVRTTAEIAASLYIKGQPGRSNHRIPLAGALELPHVDLPIDPYVLGVWLGDGTSRGGAVSYHETDFAIADNLIACGVTLSDHTDPRRPTLRTVTILGLRTHLRLMGLLRNKHIPEVYLRASRDQRLALLQGLFDTDGTCTSNGECRFTNRNHRIAMAVVDLAAGLGLLPRMTVRQVAGAPHYGVCVRPKPGTMVFRLPRKIARTRCDVPNARNRARYVAAVNPVRSVPVRCIAVDSPNHLFLITDRMIATHNTKAEQAKIVWNEAKAMVRKAPELSRRLRLGVNKIAYTSRESFWTPLSRDKDSMDGLNPHCAIADELHAHKTREPYEVIESAFGARQQPLHWSITTRGANPLNICGELDDYAGKVLRGEIHDDSFFAYVACLDDEDEWDDETAWAKANPNLGVSVKLENLRDDAAKARHMPAKQNEFRRKRCNLWTESVERWMSYEAWKSCQASVDDADLVGRPSWWGLDLSGSRDLTALVGLHDLGNGKVAVRSRFWLPERDLDEREKQDRVPYRLWVQQGWLELTPGPTVDLRVVADALAEALSRPGAVGGAYDRYKIKDVLAQLGELGFHHHVPTIDTFGNIKVEPGRGVPIVPVGQGFKDMGPATVELERLIFESAFLHGGNPVLAMCAQNAVVEFDSADNRKFNKAKANGRIDGVVAAAMAALIRKRLSADRPRSVYEELAALEAAERAAKAEAAGIGGDQVKDVVTEVSPISTADVDDELRRFRRMLGDDGEDDD
jgi:phage terminase large subunit-like protein